MTDTDYSEEEIKKLQETSAVSLVADKVEVFRDCKQWECRCGEDLEAESITQRAVECPHCMTLNIDEKSLQRDGDEGEQSSFLNW